MPKFQVEKQIWGRGRRSAYIMVEAATEEDAKDLFWEVVKEDDWAYEVEHDDSDTYVTEVQEPA